MERTASQAWRIAVLTSGHSRGSNLRAMYSYFSRHQLPVKIAFVAVSSLSAPICGVCDELGLKYLVLKAKSIADYEHALLGHIEQEQIDLIALAGFLRLLSGQFIRAVGIPILNIHPALLPAYGGKGLYGKSVHEAVFNAGDKESGATIHLVDPLYDHGKILSQKKVDISDCLSPQEIADRVLQAEHELYAPTIHSFLSQNPR